MTEKNEAQTPIQEQAQEAPGTQAEPAQVETAEPALAEQTPEVRMAAVQAELEQAKAQSSEYLDGWQRSRAEFANYRRREEQRKQQMDDEIRSRVFRQLLPVLDDLERAFRAVPEDAHDTPWVQGLVLIEKKLYGVLEKNGVSAVQPQPGDTFDPDWHESVVSEPSEELEEGRIIAVVQRGYKLNENMLRPALVRVSNGQTARGDGHS
jgi:molecular chaperone GrpE